MSNAKVNTFEDVKHLLNSQLFGVLGSNEAAQPHLNLVAFAVTPDARNIIFATARKTAKYANIKTNSRVEMLFDDRSNSPSDIEGANTLTAIGTARDATGPDLEKMREIYTAKHPYLSRFLSSADTALIALKVERYVLSGFEKTRIFDIRD